MVYFLIFITNDAFRKAREPIFLRLNFVTYTKALIVSFDDDLQVLLAKSTVFLVEDNKTNTCI